MSIEAPLFVFAKAPIAGQVKTRLYSHVTPSEAARIAEILLTETLRRCSEYWPGRVVLSVGLDPAHPAINRLAERFGVDVVAQSEGDLGQRMSDTFCEQAPCAIVGADACLIAQQSLLEAYTALQQGKSVIGPSHDGGYYLIGLQRPMPELFSRIPWGGDTVYRETCTRADTLNLVFHVLPQVHDVDEWADVIRAVEQIPSLKPFIVG